MTDLEYELMEAEQFGIRCELVGSLGTWETHPVPKHQTVIGIIRGTIRRSPGGGSDCACIHYADLSIRLPDGSRKRPDIAIFCREPDEQDTAVTLIPAAIVEVLSRGFEGKDVEIGAPFYLSQGVQDAILVDPDSGDVTHLRPGSERPLASPAEIELACGCVVTV